MVACGDGGGASFLTCAAEKCTRARERRAAPPFPRSCALGLQGGGPPPLYTLLYQISLEIDTACDLLRTNYLFGS